MSGISAAAGRMPGRLALTVALGSALWCSSCGGSEPAPAAPRLVILYATCTVNSSYLSPYNPSISFTPNLEKFAGTATVFTKHTTESGQSGISYASMFSGLQAYDHGIYRHPTRIPEEITLVSEAFADQGYETFFWSNQKMASDSLGYGQGVRPGNTFSSLTLKADDPELARILEKLQTERSYRAFLLTNFTETHAEYKKDDLFTFLERFPGEGEGISREDLQTYQHIYLRNRHQLQFNFPETVEKLALSDLQVRKLAAVIELLYKSRIWRLDRLFGDLIEQVRQAGLLDESLIVFTADHGEILYREHSHIKWEHGNVLLPDVLNVPLIIHGAALDFTPRRWEGVTRSIDLYPTMLGLSGLAAPEPGSIEGVDLTPYLRGEKAAPQLQAFSHTTAPLTVPKIVEAKKEWTLMNRLFPETGIDSIWASVREGDNFYRWRNLGDGRWDFEAFDLARDPWAARNLFDESNPEHRQMAEELRAYKARLVEHFRDDERMRPEEGDALDRLKSLGYVK